MKHRMTALAVLMALATTPAWAQEVPGTSPANSAPGTPTAPDWAYPDYPGHRQVAPPADFHRPSRVEDTPIGLFDGQADVGGALVPGQGTVQDGRYTITSAGYNMWYGRDEFRFLWKKMSGDVSLAADVAFPNPVGYGDRKALLVIRQSLDDDAPEMVVGLHGTGMFHIAWRPAKGAEMVDMEYKVGSRGALKGEAVGGLVTLHPQRIGIEKKGDAFTLWVSEQGEPMHPYGAPIPLHLTEPFYAGIGFVSHLPTTPDTAVLSGVVLENVAGKVR
ncbi:biopolymer transporter Tol [Nitrospirillum sp. BR 11163]|uniref:biopolymer transporter Tol n=1 Tax=Nitrospirillum sp. BR 11163 TaxID=3104323 RepID=UPI002AFFCE84|nr:biopolymer transporter Tol [Nitrospirillum sp. BR 11163]MEA1676005.1 biopolymer transporter Tol [Nitrospirillum sp. BR 11163]